MIIHIVRFRSSLPDEQIAELFQARASQYLALPGMLQKYYTCVLKWCSTWGVRLGHSLLHPAVHGEWPNPNDFDVDPVEEWRSTSPTSLSLAPPGPSA